MKTVSKPGQEVRIRHREELGKAITAVREQAGHTQDKFAEEVGVHARALRRWESGEITLSASNRKLVFDQVSKLEGTPQVRILKDLLRSRQPTVQMNNRHANEIEVKVAILCGKLAPEQTFETAKMASFIRTTLESLPTKQHPRFIGLVQSALIEDSLGECLPINEAELRQASNLQEDQRSFLMFCQQEMIQGGKLRELMLFVWQERVLDLASLTKGVYLVPTRERRPIGGEPDLQGGTHLQWLRGRCNAWKALLRERDTPLRNLARGLQAQQQRASMYAGRAGSPDWDDALSELELIGIGLKKAISGFFGCANG